MPPPSQFSHHKIARHHRNKIHTPDPSLSLSPCNKNAEREKKLTQMAAQGMASMAGLRTSSQTVLEGTLQISGPTLLKPAGTGRLAVTRPGHFAVRAQHQTAAETEAVARSSRRAALGLVAAGIASGSFVKAVLAEAKPIKVGPPPPPSGGLPGTLNSDEARDLDLPLKNRFFLQALSPPEAAARAKESAKEILNVKGLIEKKAWPYVQNDLRNRASYLRFDLNTIISAKSKDEKKSLKDLTAKLFANIDDLDHAAKIKSPTEAEKYYAATASALNDVLSKIG